MGGMPYFSSRLKTISPPSFFVSPAGGMPRCLRDPGAFVRAVEGPSRPWWTQAGKTLGQSARASAPTGLSNWALGELLGLGRGSWLGGFRSPRRPRREKE
eukprot:8187537-Pyramimonas_sp.AAC.1